MTNDHLMNVVLAPLTANEMRGLHDLLERCGGIVDDNLNGDEPVVYEPEELMVLMQELMNYTILLKAKLDALILPTAPARFAGIPEEKRGTSI
jgi:hypothetical protein